MQPKNGRRFRASPVVVCLVIKQPLPRTFNPTLCGGVVIRLEWHLRDPEEDLAPLVIVKLLPELAHLGLRMLHMLY